MHKSTNSVCNDISPQKMLLLYTEEDQFFHLAIHSIYAVWICNSLLQFYCWDNVLNYFISAVMIGYCILHCHIREHINNELHFVIPLVLWLDGRHCGCKYQLSVYSTTYN